MADLLRSLENYKQMHMPRAEQNGVAKELQNARTLTQARKIVFGEKRKQYVARRDPVKK